MKAKSPQVTIKQINGDSLTIAIGTQTHSLPFSRYPWFAGKPEKAVRNLKVSKLGHLRWPDLDVDLSTEIIKHPERYPLKAKVT